MANIITMAICHSISELTKIFFCSLLFEIRSFSQQTRQRLLSSILHYQLNLSSVFYCVFQRNNVIMVQCKQVLNLILYIFQLNIIHLVYSIVGFDCKLQIALFLDSRGHHRETAFSDMGNYFIIIQNMRGLQLRDQKSGPQPREGEFQRFFEKRFLIYSRVNMCKYLIFSLICEGCWLLQTCFIFGMQQPLFQLGSIILEACSRLFLLQHFNDFLRIGHHRWKLSFPQFDTCAIIFFYAYFFPLLVYFSLILSYKAVGFEHIFLIVHHIKFILHYNQKSFLILRISYNQILFEVSTLFLSALSCKQQTHYKAGSIQQSLLILLVPLELLHHPAIENFLLLGLFSQLPSLNVFLQVNCLHSNLHAFSHCSFQGQLSRESGFPCYFREMQSNNLLILKTCQQNKHPSQTYNLQQVLMGEQSLIPGLECQQSQLTYFRAIKAFCYVYLLCIFPFKFDYQLQKGLLVITHKCYGLRHEWFGDNRSKSQRQSYPFRSVQFICSVFYNCFKSDSLIIWMSSKFMWQFQFQLKTPTFKVFPSLFLMCLTQIVSCFQILHHEEYKSKNRQSVFPSHLLSSYVISNHTTILGYYNLSLYYPWKAFLGAFYLHYSLFASFGYSSCSYRKSKLQGLSEVQEICTIGILQVGQSGIINCHVHQVYHLFHHHHHSSFPITDNPHYYVFHGTLTCIQIQQRLQSKVLECFFGHQFLPFPIWSQNNSHLHFYLIELSANYKTYCCYFQGQSDLEQKNKLYLNEQAHGSLCPYRKTHRQEQLLLLLPA